MKFSLYEIAFGLALLTGQADAFWRMECRGRSALARIDPLVNPGADANHLHTVAGGSGKCISLSGHNVLHSASLGTVVTLFGYAATASLGADTRSSAIRTAS